MKQIMLTVLVATGLGACTQEEPATTTEPEPGRVAAGNCLEGGELRASLAGSLRTELSWSGADLSCEGMQRPADAGARLRFSGPIVIDGEPLTLTFILGVPDLEEGQTASELPTNVTLMAEGSGRFYGTPDTGNCWTDVSEHAPVDAPLTGNHRISGDLFCIAPIAELNGNASVTLAALSFTGQLTWQPSDQ